MTLLRALGAESNSANEFDLAYSMELSGSSACRRSGNYCFSIDSYHWGDVFIPAKAEIFIQFSFYATGTNNNQTLIWKKGSNILGRLDYNTGSRKLLVYIGNGTTLVITSNKTIAASELHLIELHIILGDAGLIELRIDGITVGTFSGDTKPGADADIDTIRFNSSNYGTQWYCDDIIINSAEGSVNNSWPSGARVALLLPSGAGSSTQFTPSAGANYQCVDELPPTVTDYNYINADGQLDLFALANLPATASIILALIPNVWALKAGIPAVNNLKTAYKTPGNAVRLSTDFPLPTTLSLIREVIETNPDTGNPFTTEEINGLEYGYQSAS